MTPKQVHGRSRNISEPTNRQCLCGAAAPCAVDSGPFVTGQAMDAVVPHIRLLRWGGLFSLLPPPPGFPPERASRSFFQYHSFLSFFPSYHLPETPSWLLRMSVS